METLGLPKGRFPPAHPPTHRQAPQARGRSPHHPPSVHAIPTACTSSPRHGGEGARVRGRTGTRAQGREVTRCLSKKKHEQTTSHEGKPQALPATSHPRTCAHIHIHTQWARRRCQSWQRLGGPTTGSSLPTPQVEGRGGGVVTSVVTTAKNSLTLYVPPSRL